MIDTKRHRIAVHEAGHAVACMALHVPIDAVTICGEATIHGQVRSSVTTAGTSFAIIALAASEAERALLDEVLQMASDADLVSAVRRLCLDRVSWVDMVPMLAKLRCEAALIVAKHGDSIASLAEALMERETLSGVEAFGFVSVELRTEAGS